MTVRLKYDRGHLMMIGAYSPEESKAVISKKNTTNNLEKSLKNKEQYLL